VPGACRRDCSSIRWHGTCTHMQAPTLCCWRTTSRRGGRTTSSTTPWLGCRSRWAGAETSAGACQNAHTQPGPVQPWALSLLVLLLLKPPHSQAWARQQVQLWASTADARAVGCLRRAAAPFLPHLLALGAVVLKGATAAQVMRQLMRGERRPALVLMQVGALGWMGRGRGMAAPTGATCCCLGAPATALGRPGGGSGQMV
jgi:hypothetical protein